MSELIVEKQEIWKLEKGGARNVEIKMLKTRAVLEIE